MRKTGKLIVFIVIMVFSINVGLVNAFGEEDAGLDITAKSAILIDGNTGKVLYEKNSHEELPPASVTKVMSMLLVLEAEDRGDISFEDVVTISERASEMGGSQMFLETGEQHTVMELLKGTAMASANDACVCLSEYIAGSESEFVNLMNKRAEELGLKNTHFENTNGLPVSNHYSSSYDIAMISKELMKHEEIRPFLVTWMDTIKVGLPGKEKDFGLNNTNKLIKRYSGATGIKTGYTADAKFCLSGSAKRGDLELIGVILGGETSDLRFSEMKAMLDYGFNAYDSKKVGVKGVSLGTVMVEKGDCDSINAVLDEDVNILIKKDEKNTITTETTIEERISAPVKKGDKVGEFRVLNNGKVIEKYDIVAKKNVEKWKLIDIIKELIGYSFIK